MPIQDKFAKAKQFGQEFKDFIAKGNAIDLAVGVVIGTAFNAVVDSLVKDIIMGAIANFFHKPDFSAFAYGAIKWGSFINSIINLIIVGLSVFITIKLLHKIIKKREKEEAEQKAIA